MAGDTKFEERLQTFAARAKRVAPLCVNEQQTKVSLINPYLEALGYDIRDPAVCRFEYTADLGGGKEKVDYAIMRDSAPKILIEAKAATADFSHVVAAPGQLQRYFMTENAEFAALTNGIVWQWYKGNQKGKLEDPRFLVHDVRFPKKAEMQWLEGIAGPRFDPEKANERADAAQIASAITNWIEETRHRPSDQFVGIIMKEKNLGQQRTKRLEQVRQSFIATFEEYVDRETNRVLAAARDQQREESRHQSGMPGDNNAPKREREPRIVPLDDGGPPLNPSSQARAWRLKGGTWKRESNGRDLFVAVMRHLASIDVRGSKRFYDEAVTASG
ncbi:MAG: type I restriction enzyme HsdR N-terminal domain-containing protein, partial [Rhodospirillaceae bacterium]|nr:type I restriction enzyme HsdR N-terminal domain-containing protein [Rhodospirillaceae bacterium]